MGPRCHRVCGWSYSGRINSVLATKPGGKYKSEYEHKRMNLCTLNLSKTAKELGNFWKILGKYCMFNENLWGLKGYGPSFGKYPSGLITLYNFILF